jgi:PTS system nitrogen regulatory IIA component
MAHNDFDLAGLAAYLHLSVAQVTRLVERGKLPGRRVAGQWRFSTDEIHHWLEQRIGLSNDEELAEMEGTLRRSLRDPAALPVALARLLRPQAIAIPLDARTRSSAIQEMVALAARTGLVWDPAEMAAAVRAREDLMPTAQEGGVALLHPRRPLPGILAEPLVALGRTERPIPFGGERGALVDLFFLICSVDDRGHLQTLARLSRLLTSGDFLGRLRAAGDAAAAHQVVVLQEEELTA